MFGFQVSRAAGIAAFHAVVGQRYHVRPPAFGSLIRLGGQQRGGHTKNGDAIEFKDFTWNKIITHHRGGRRASFRASFRRHRGAGPGGPAQTRGSAPLGSIRERDLVWLLRVGGEIGFVWYFFYWLFF